MRWFKLDLNPEPWAIGPVGYGRHNGKMSAYVGRNAQLDAFKEGVRELLTNFFVDHPEADPGIETGEVELVMYFWRSQDEYTSAGNKKIRKHQVDLTNMQKALEDALQGVLISNDRNVRKVNSETRDQGLDVIPCIVVGIQPYKEDNLPIEVLALLDKDQPALPFDEDSARWVPEGEIPF